MLVLFNRGMPELQRTLKEHDLLAVHYAIFVALSEAPDRTLRLSDVADMANLSQSRLTHRLRTLVDRGEVRIEQDPVDGRAKNAVLTELGLARLQAVAPLHVEDVRRVIFDHLDRQQVNDLAGIMSVIAANLCEHPHFQPPAAR